MRFRLLPVPCSSLEIVRIAGRSICVDFPFFGFPNDDDSILQVPFVLLVLFIMSIMYKSEWVFPIGFISGLVLDMLLFRPLGLSSMFFILFLFLVFLYERKFELRSIWFVVMMSCFGSFAYLLFFGNVFLIVQVLFSVGLCVLLFLAFSVFNPIPQKDKLGTWKSTR